MKMTAPVSQTPHGFSLVCFHNLALSFCFILALWVAPPFLHAAGFDQSHGLYEKVLKKYAQDGFVDYAALKSDPKDLNAYVKSFSTVKKEEFTTWPENKQKAFLINLYNAATLQLVVDHYPVSSIKKIGGFFRGPWKVKFIQLFGDTTTLHHIEHNLLRKDYDDPRIHFALVCASLGCPALAEEPYLPKVLNEQLDKDTRKFLLDPSKNWADTRERILYLSPIFKWFKQDFTKKSGSVRNFVGAYLPKKLPDLDRYKIKYTHYSWSLNDKKND